MSSQWLAYWWITVPVLAATTYHLLAIATLTESMWSRYPAWLLKWARCPACSGTWYGAVWYLSFTSDVRGAFMAGLWSCFWVPLLAYIHYAALMKFAPTEVEICSDCGGVNGYHLHLCGKGEPDGQA